MQRMAFIKLLNLFTWTANIQPSGDDAGIMLRDIEKKLGALTEGQRKKTAKELLALVRIIWGAGEIGCCNRRSVLLEYVE